MPRASSSYRSPPVAPKANVRAPKRPTTVSVVTVTIRGRGEVSFLDWRAVPGFQGVEADPHGLAVPGGSSFLVAHTDENGKIEYDDLAHPERALDQVRPLRLPVRHGAVATRTRADLPCVRPIDPLTSLARLDQRDRPPDRTTILYDNGHNEGPAIGPACRLDDLPQAHGDRSSAASCRTKEDKISERRQ